MTMVWITAVPYWAEKYDRKENVKKERKKVLRTAFRSYMIIRIEMTETRSGTAIGVTSCSEIWIVLIWNFVLASCKQTKNHKKEPKWTPSGVPGWWKHVNSLKYAAKLGTGVLHGDCVVVKTTKFPVFSLMQTVSFLFLTTTNMTAVQKISLLFVFS